MPAHWSAGGGYGGCLVKASREMLRCVRRPLMHELPVRLQVAAGADPQAALAAAAQDSPGNLVVFGTNNGFLEDQKAANDRYLGFRG